MNPTLEFKNGESKNLSILLLDDGTGISYYDLEISFQLVLVC